jgi:thiol-disulfide isomerase/thioredoxin
MMRANSRITLISLFVAVLMLSSAGCNAANESSAAGQTVEMACPGLASISLGQGVLAKLPKGVLLSSGNFSVSAKDLEAEIAQASPEDRTQLKKNCFFLLEQMATEKLLAQAAREKALSAGVDISTQENNEILRNYFETLTAGIAVSDSEVAAFYRENQEACGGATLEQMKDQLRQYVLQQKKKKFVAAHVSNLGKILSIRVSAPWVKAQAVLARENPVDKARASGKPSMVDFGAEGCRPCDMMAPILEELKTEYTGRVNVLFVHVRQEQILAERFGIQAIPVQVFFDKDGREVFRHTGFLPRAEIEGQFKKMGIE